MQPLFLKTNKQPNPPLREPCGFQCYWSSPAVQCKGSCHGEKMKCTLAPESCWQSQSFSLLLHGPQPLASFYPEFPLQLPVSASPLLLSLSCLGVIMWFKSSYAFPPKVTNNIEVVFLQIRESWCFNPGKALSFPHLLTLHSSHIYEKHPPSNQHYLIFRSSHFSVTRLLSLGTLPAKCISMPQFPIWITTQTLATDSCYTENALLSH